MRPLNSRNFGPGPGAIRVRFHNGTSEVNGYIVKQLSWLRYRVTADGTTFFDIRLAQTTAEATTLAPGIGRISIFNNGANAVLQPVLEADVAGPASPGSGGTGYTVGDVVTATGGVGTALSMSVGIVSAGVITSFNWINRGAYTTLPGTTSGIYRLLPTTGGTGTGAVIRALMRIKNINIVSGGSGYVAGQQITFASGGSGATLPTATVSSVDANGAITGIAVATTGFMSEVPTVVPTEQLLGYVSRLTDKRAVLTNNASVVWSATSQPRIDRIP